MGMGRSMSIGMLQMFIVFGRKTERIAYHDPGDPFFEQIIALWVLLKSLEKIKEK